MKNVSNHGTIENLKNYGTISSGPVISIANYTNNIIENLINEGEILTRKDAIINYGGEIKNVINRGKIIFTHKQGSQIENKDNGKINITEWKITINKSAAEYNSAVDLSNGNADHLDRIIIYNYLQAQPQNITFSDGAIKLEAGEKFEIGKEYNLENVVLLNTVSSTTAQIAGDKINGGVALTGKNFGDANPNDMVDFKFLDNDTKINSNNATKNPNYVDPNNPGGGSVIADINHKKSNFSYAKSKFKQ